MQIDTVARPGVAAAKRVVLKIGTRVIAGDDGRVRLARLFGVVEAAGALRDRGRDVLIVSSGAVGLGTDALGFERARPTSSPSVRRAPPLGRRG